VQYSSLSQVQYSSLSQVQYSSLSQVQYSSLSQVQYFEIMPSTEFWLQLNDILSLSQEHNFKVKSSSIF
jgi:hypothetical protein